MTSTWAPLPPAEVAQRLLGAAGDHRPAVLAVNGYSSSGKTSVAARLRLAVPRAAIVHTDDLAWYHSVLGWDDLLVDGILRPVRRGEPVAYRPPSWVDRGRAGSIEVPADVDLLIVEGVGAGRRSLAAELDVHVWVECYTSVRASRNAIRIAAGEMGFRDYEGWTAEENQHMLTDRPWERADLVVAGDGRVTLDDPDDLLVAAAASAF